MYLNTIVAVRSRSCHVKTMHTLLRINLMCIENQVQHEISYVNDDTYDKIEMINRKIKGVYDKILFLDFGVFIDEESLKQVFEKHTCLVFPAVKFGINWDMFKSKMIHNVNEPASQAGLEFDTDVSKKISDGIYKVTDTDPKTWVMDPKLVQKALKGKKGEGMYKSLSIKDLFDHLVPKLTVTAFTKAKISVSYSHECVSNILEAAGVKVS